MEEESSMNRRSLFGAAVWTALTTFTHHHQHWLQLMSVACALWMVVVVTATLPLPSNCVPTTDPVPPASANLKRLRTYRQRRPHE